jgi:hypothetical protein
MIAFAGEGEGRARVQQLRQELFGLANQLPVPGRHKKRDRQGRFAA